MHFYVQIECMATHHHPCPQRQQWVLEKTRLRGLKPRYVIFLLFLSLLFFISFYLIPFTCRHPRNIGLLQMRCLHICPDYRHENHFTAFIYWQGSSVIEYGDSMHHPPPQHILPILQWVFMGVLQHEITHIKSGIISKQGIGSGAGSCGLAALNFIQRAAETPKGLQPWSGLEARLFCDIALECLLNFHHLATQSEGTFTNWTTKIFRDDEIYGSSEMVIDNSMATGYSDYNLYMPMVKTPFFLLETLIIGIELCRPAILSCALTN